MKSIIFSSFAIIMIASVQAKVYSPCEFAQYLASHGIDRNQIPTWSCIASHESNYNTQAINPTTGDYGILQISSIFWCNNADTPGKGCGITCSSLLGDDIAEDLTCAKTVYDETQRLRGNGFTAWTTYQFCNGDNSQYVQGCNY